MGDENRDTGMVGVVRKVHPRHVIWFLMTALIAVILFVGSEYRSRVEALEDHKKEQNGHLREISSDMKHVVEVVKEVRTEQREMKHEQTKMKIDVEVIKSKIEDGS